MKKIPAFLIILFAIAFSSAAQNYYIIKIEGSVKVDNNEVSTGDKLTEKSVLQYGSKTDKLYLLSPEKGYFLLSPQAKGDNADGWIVVLKEAVLPKNQYYTTTTRGNSSSAYFDDKYDLMGFFRHKVMLLEDNSFKYNSENIPLDENNYIEFTRIPESDNKNICCSFNNNSFSITGKSKGDMYELNYFQNGDKIKIGTFNLIIKSREAVEREIAVFFDSNSDKNYSLIYFNEVKPFITEAYGNTNMEEIKSIIREDLKIPLKIIE